MTTESEKLLANMDGGLSMNDGFNLINKVENPKILILISGNEATG